MDQHSYTPRFQNVAGEGAVASHGFVAAVASAAEGEVAEPREECGEDDDEVLLAVVAACGMRYRRIPKPTKETTDQ